MAGHGGVLLVGLIVFALWIWVSYWVSQDAKRRGSSHHVAWGVGVFFIGLIALILYLVVRGDISQ